jgi:hypothetical protein
VVQLTCDKVRAEAAEMQNDGTGGEAVRHAPSPLLPDANNFGGVFARVGLLVRGPVNHSLCLANRHDGRLFLIFDEGNAFEFTFLAAHYLREHWGFGVAITDFVLLDEVTLVDVFHEEARNVGKTTFYVLAALAVDNAEE